MISAPNAFTGAERLVDAYGLGNLVPNTVLLGDSQDPAHRDRYCQMIRHFHQARRNVVIVRDDENRGFGDRRRIDVWWGGLQGNGALMLILAYLLRTDVSWQQAEVRLKVVVASEAPRKDAQSNLSCLLTHIRTGARPDVLVAGDRPFVDVLKEESSGADLVLLDMAEPGDDFRSYYEDLRDRTDGLPSTLFVLAAEEIAFRVVLLQEDEAAD